MVKSFLRCCIYLVKFSYWSKFDANILTASGAITIFVSKGFDLRKDLSIGVEFVNEWFGSHYNHFSP